MRLGVGAGVAVAVVALAACGGDDEPDSRDRPNKEVQSAQLGEPLTLRGDAGQQLEVTVTGVQDPVEDHALEDARVSGRFVGVELRIENDGRIPFRGSPTSGASLSTSAGAARPTAMLTDGSCVSARRRVIAPGSRQRACIPFRVPESGELLQFRYTPNAGFAPEAGVWELGP